jgi:hypothetical protein
MVRDGLECSQTDALRPFKRPAFKCVIQTASF